MEEINYYTDDRELAMAIHKAMEIFAILKDMILKLDEQIVSLEDKKYLSLFLGIRNTENRINNLLKLFYGDLELTIEITELEENQALHTYSQYFQELMPELLSESKFEAFMIKLLNIPFILKLHTYYDYPINKVQIALKEALNSKKLIKTLQN